MTEESDKIWNKPKIKVLVYDVWCWYRELIYSNNWHKNDPVKVCPICNLPLSIGCNTYMVINNGKLFPNTLIHKSCVGVSLTATTLDLIKSYDKFIECMNKNKTWVRARNYDI